LERKRGTKNTPKGGGQRSLQEKAFRIGNGNGNSRNRSQKGVCSTSRVLLRLVHGPSKKKRKENART